MNPENGVPVSVVIPAYNEEGAVAEVVSGARRALRDSGREEGRDFEVLVVDDGSTDATAEAARAAGARVVSHPVNMGYGRSLLTGFENARFDWLLTADGDGSYPPSEFVKLLPYAPRFDMVVGSRQGSFFWGNPFRAFLRWTYLSLAGFVAGIRIPDANSGLRLIHRAKIQPSMPVLCYGYSLSTTMTLSFLQAGCFVTFVPVAYVARKGRSKVRMLRDVLRTLQIMTQVILYYNPLKFAVFLTLLPIAGSAFFLARPLLGAGAPLDSALAALCLLSALFVFLVGCLLDSLRLHHGPLRKTGG